MQRTMVEIQQRRSHTRGFIFPYQPEGTVMNNIVYIVGAIVIVGAVLSFFGLRYSKHISGTTRELQEDLLSVRRHLGNGWIQLLRLSVKYQAAQKFKFLHYSDLNTA